MPDNKVKVVNGAVTGVFLGRPMQDAKPAKPEDNEPYFIQRTTESRLANSEELLEKQPEPVGGDNLIDKFIVGSVTEIVSNAESISQYGLAYRTELTSANFPMVTTMGEYTFQSCSKLTEVNFPLLSKVPKSAFSSCKALTKVNFPLATKVDQDAFGYCESMTEICLPSVTEIGNGNYSSTFKYCKSLRIVDLPKATKLIGYTFDNCYNLVAVILRSETMCQVTSSSAFSQSYRMKDETNATHNPDGVHDGYVYVPSALKASYEADSSWINTSVHFRALEDYTVDGTISGELDLSKI